MMLENMEDEQNKNTPPLFEKRRQEDGFNVPEGYFDSLEDRVFGRIEAAGIQRSTPLKVLKKPAGRMVFLRICMAAAAVFVLVLAAVWFIRPVNTTGQPVASIELTEEEIETYVLENVQDFEAEQLASLPEEDENEYQAPKQTAPEKATDSLEDLSPEDVEQILNDMTEEELEEIL